MSLQSHLQKSTYRLLKHLAREYEKKTGKAITDKEIVDRALKCYEKTGAWT